MIFNDCHVFILTDKARSMIWGTASSQKGDESSRETLIELIVSKPLQAVGSFFQLEGTLSQRLSPCASCFFIFASRCVASFACEVLLAVNNISGCCLVLEHV